MSNRDNQDPMTMYLIVRESLLGDMTIGKVAAQVAHAADWLRRDFNKLDRQYDAFLNRSNSQPFHNLDQLLEWRDWEKENHRKVVLKASDKEWKKLKEEITDDMVEVVDAGYTCLEPGTATVIGLWPMRKSQRSKLLQRLQAL